jgi:hypothetical protein
MGKFIVKNCELKRELISPDKIKDYCTDKRKKCCDCEDCLPKQIIEKCRSQMAEFDDEIKNGNYDPKFKWFKSGRSDAGYEILNMFDIEEVEDE